MRGPSLKTITRPRTSFRTPSFPPIENLSSSTTISISENGCAESFDTNVSTGFEKQKRTPIPDTEIVDIELDIAAWQSAREAGSGELFDELELCLSRLPEKLKDAVTAFYLQEQSGAETAETLEISPSTVRKRLERARDQLHLCLTGKLDHNLQPLS